MSNSMHFNSGSWLMTLLNTVQNHYQNIHFVIFSFFEANFLCQFILRLSILAIFLLFILITPFFLAFYFSMNLMLQKLNPHHSYSFLFFLASFFCPVFIVIVVFIQIPKSSSFLLSILAHFFTNLLWVRYFHQMIDSGLFWKLFLFLILKEDFFIVGFWS